MFKGLRALVFLRRIARSLESIAKSQHAMALIMGDDWKRRNAAAKPQPSDFSIMDITEVNKRYHERREAEAAGVDYE
jgi:hypothetical protein